MKRCLCTLLLLSGAAGAVPLGTAFTYQGQLKQSGQPATGLYDLQVCVFETALSPASLGCAPDIGDVPVDAGLFTVTLDFGSTLFAGEERWLELRVRPGASGGAYSVLEPRQLLRASPEALRAAAASAAPWTGLTGVPAGFADNVDNLGTGTVSSVAAGAGLTGGTITGSGTLAIATGGVVQSMVAGDAIDSARIVDASVANADLGADSVNALQIAANAVAASELANDAVDTNAIVDANVTSAKIAPGAVGTAQIDTAQVQARVAGVCALGSYLRGINADGSAVCTGLPNPHTFTVGDDQNFINGFSSLAIGADGLGIISYHDQTAGTLKVLKCGNFACSAGNTVSTVDNPANFVAPFTSIAVPASGLPMIAYYDMSAGTLKLLRCLNTACTNGVATTIDDPPANNVGQFLSIAIAGDDRAVISYHDSTAGTLKVLKCGNTNCDAGNVATTVDDPPANSVGSYNALRIGADGLPVIGYFDSTSIALKVLKCGNAACNAGNTTTTVDNPGSVGDYVSLAIGADGLPVISYRDSNAGRVKVVKCGNAACNAGNTLTTIATAITGDYTSIVIAADGFPIIGHRGFGASLAVTKCGNAACSAGNVTNVVDDPPVLIVGISNSVVIGPDGLPLISHIDGTNGALRIVKCGNAECQ